MGTMDEINFPGAIFDDKDIVQKKKTVTPEQDEIAQEAYEEQYDRAAQSAALGVRFEESGEAQRYAARFDMSAFRR